MSQANESKRTLTGIGRGAGIAALAGALLGSTLSVVKDSDVFDPGPPFFEPF